MNFMKPFGLGDLAYYMFRPAIYLIDWVFGSDMKHCQVCKDRRILWNGIFTRPAYFWLGALALAVILISL